MQDERRRIFQLLVALLREADQIWIADMSVDTTLRFFTEHLEARRARRHTSSTAAGRSCATTASCAAGSTWRCCCGN
jgi:hypothetical protein